MTKREQVFAYAGLWNIEDWLRLGWLPHDSLGGCKHGDYAVLVEWCCSCPLKAPRLSQLGKAIAMKRNGSS
jgi:hypothetical protein